MLKHCNITKDQAWPRASHSTIKNDVACFIRTYASQLSSTEANRDDSLESPLTELGLIKPVSSKRDEFRFVRGPKSTLGNGAFVYALLEFWLDFSKTSTTLSFEAIAHEPGSPGRVFLLDENDVADRLSNIDAITNDNLHWSETAGLKQVVRNSAFTLDKALEFVESDYEDMVEAEIA